MKKYLDILQTYWGHKDFRSLQGDIIQSISEGKDSLALMPTGGGKSITFQVPAMDMEGVCLVVTPLIALMKDQVENLKKRRIKAAAIFSGMTKNEIIVTLENCIYGDYKFLYVSPERLVSELFQSRLQHMTISMIAVDEAHCISQWGYDFRPSYLRIAEIRSQLPNVPVLALTATATPEVVKDIQRKLNLKEENVFQKSFERENVAYVVRYAEDKIKQLLSILNNVPGTAIVYIRERKKTKEIADILNKNGITAAHFHAGLTSLQKDTRQKNWKENKTRVIVATNAFGMGIDKPDVRSVIHLDLPDSLEAYFQEAGRAGRDEKKAYAVVIHNKKDATKIKKRFTDAFPEKDKILTVYEKLGFYFELAVGSGKEMVYPFNLLDFCKKFKLALLPTYNSLKILEQAEYLELTDELDNPSRLLFTIKRDNLYYFQTNNADLDRLIQVLLRSYTGIFSEYAHINEDILAQRTKTDRDTIYKRLISLSRLGAVSYIPAKKTPFIIYTCNRLETKQVTLSKEVYNLRKERYQKRTDKMLSYVSEDTVCRSQFLLRYFGEKDVSSCKHCDVCLKEKESTIKEKDFDNICQAVKEILSAEPLDIEQITSKTKIKDDKIISVIRHLTDNKIIIRNDKNQFLLKK
jgi:ATP-dependent DNA helicase RecQ